MSNLNLKEYVFNTWQIYQKGDDMYNNGATSGIHKIKHVNYRQDVYKMTVYKKDNDVMIVSRTSSRLNFAFIGSDDFKDWKNNFEIELGEDGIHEGFNDSVKKFLDIIKDEAAKFESKFGHPPVITFIGHSRGGALALLAAMYIEEHNIEFELEYEVRCITFGQPRVGNHLFCERLSKLDVHYTRVVFSRDPVCEIPPTEMEYEHPWFGELVILPEQWWHRLRVMFKRVHLGYNDYISNTLYKEITKKSDPKWDRG